MLDPKHNQSMVSGEEINSTYSVLTALSHYLGLDAGKVLGSFAKYRTKQGLWQEDGICQSKQHISPSIWWKGLYGSEFLAAVASILLQSHQHQMFLSATGHYLGTHTLKGLQQANEWASGEMRGHMGKPRSFWAWQRAVLNKGGHRHWRRWQVSWGSEHRRLWGSGRSMKVFSKMQNMQKPGLKSLKKCFIWHIEQDFLGG